MTNKNFMNLTHSISPVLVDELNALAKRMNPCAKDLSRECPQINAAPLFGSGTFVRIGYPDIHPSVSLWGPNTNITGYVIIGKDSAIYPGCNFMGDAMMPLVIGERCSLQHVELHYSGFRMLSTQIGDDCFLSHLAFGHSVRMGKRCYILGHVTMFDGAEIGDDVFIEGNSTILGDARLKSGFAYEGRVDRDTKPMCRTSEVVFGIDPTTGETRYIGGTEGVADVVNRSHLRRNDNQMRLVAFKHGLPELGLPAFAVTIPHVFEAGKHYLALAALVLERMSEQELATDCRDLCASIRTIYEGQPATAEAARAWGRRTTIINEVVSVLDQQTELCYITIPSLPGKEVIQDRLDLLTMMRKLREFDDVMQGWASDSR